MVSPTWIGAWSGTRRTSLMGMHAQARRFSGAPPALARKLRCVAR